jgi:cytidylate kinase
LLLEKSLTKVLTIDGASGTGKTSVSQMLANELGYHLLLSGLIYRLVAYQDLTLNQMMSISVSDIKINSKSRQIEFYYLGKSCLDQLMRPQVAEMASIKAKDSAVRKALLPLQRSFAQGAGLIAEGRDMGSVVFPDAALKVFLTASDEVRASRRAKQLQLAGKSFKMRELLEKMSKRDTRDLGRKCAPLVCPENSVAIDTSNMVITEVVQTIIKSLHVV